MPTKNESTAVETTNINANASKVSERLTKESAFDLFTMLSIMHKMVKPFRKGSDASACGLTDMRADIEARWNANIARLKSAKDLSCVAYQRIEGVSERIPLGAPQLGGIADTGFSVKFDALELATD